MKKVLLGLVALSSLTFAEGLFDFQNAKIVSGTKFNTEAEFKGTFDKGKTGQFDANHNIGAKTTLYEFATIHANVKYEGTAPADKTKPVRLSGDSSIGFELNFQEYGKASAKLRADKQFKLGYKNNFDVDGIKSNIEADYTLDYTQKEDKGMTTTAASASPSAQTTAVEKNGQGAGTSSPANGSEKKYEPLKHNGNIKLGAEYNVLDNLKVFGHVKLGIDFNGNNYQPGAELGAEYVNYVKSVTKLGYENSFSVSENVSYEIKEDLLKVKGLRVTPSFEAKAVFKDGVKDVDFNMEPKVSASYDIISGLSANASVSTLVKFGHGDSKFDYKGVEPKLNLGLSYTLN